MRETETRVRRCSLQGLLACLGASALVHVRLILRDPVAPPL